MTRSTNRQPVVRYADQYGLASSLADQGSSLAWKLLFVISAIIAAGHLLLTARLLDGNMLNSYPFLASDSYDWLLEGYSLTRWLEGAPPPDLPILRNPTFVILSFLDYAVVGSGHLVLVAIALSFFILLASVVMIGRFLSGAWPVVAAAVTTIVVSPLGFWRVFVLPDLLATALMVATAALLVRYWQTRRASFILAASGVGIVAGLTQYYALVPFLVIAGWLFVRTLHARQPVWTLGLASGFVLLAVLGMHAGWRMAIPHDGSPEPFRLFQFSADMASFYGHTWIFVLGVFIPIGIALLGRWRVIATNPIAQACWLAALALLAGSFFYQWEESRFTLASSAMVVVALVVSASIAEARSASRSMRASFIVSALLALVVGLSFVPETYWRPNLRTIEIAPERSWAAQLLLSEPQDRFQVDKHCQPDAVICDSAPLPNWLSPYERVILEAFKSRSPDEAHP